MEDQLKSNSFKIEPLNQEFYDSAINFLEQVFHKEQSIPKELIPLKNDSEKWWCIISDGEVLGIVAAWKIKSEWHWGRLAIDKKLRGLGLGKKIAVKSLNDLFHMGIEEVYIDARDITVSLLLKIGGKITGKKTSFYGASITPMKIMKNDFIHINT
ncbi:GNAT family N-acetyltransferase [uncultured Roseivirga sp.]|uniref:GNAT family N-acetyltransferase n=1 Tax=uncultured Roseivirga sp. TaxID=543088 RepID=UPI0030D870E8